MKRFLSIFFVFCAFVIGFMLLDNYLSENFLWKSIDDYREIESLPTSSLSSESLLLVYKPKFEYAVDYLESLLGGGKELTDYLVVVDISEQTEYIFDNEGNIIDTYRISTGESGTDREMTESLWRVSSKIDYEVAPLYGPRMMMLERYFQGEWITTTVALHGTNEPTRIGTPFSLGCVYHNNADIITLFDLLSIGDFVVAID